jgi:hypothetical protein
MRNKIVELTAELKSAGIDVDALLAATAKNDKE